MKAAILLSTHRRHLSARCGYPETSRPSSSGTSLPRPLANGSVSRLDLAIRPRTNSPAPSG